MNKWDLTGFAAMLVIFGIAINTDDIFSVKFALWSVVIISLLN